MSTGQGIGASSDLDVVRREYESSWSWRLTRPVRAIGRLGRSARSSATRGWRPPTAFSAGAYDTWLEHFHGDVLGSIDKACARDRPDRYTLFRELDDDLWSLLLTQDYRVYPNIRAVLPGVPDPSLQQMWNGASGVALAAQSQAFYRKVKERFTAACDVSLEQARVLDFGCGWGRLTRYFARDVPQGRLYGCDPVEQILDMCREQRVPATLARTDFVPRRLPFDAPFDLAFSFSVFTHMSEKAHAACLDALHSSIRPGGLLIVTVRPPQYLRFSKFMHPALESLGPNYLARLNEPRYLFVPHPAEPSHLQYEGGEMTYGETVITLPYVRERWSPRFELLEVDLLMDDLYQVMLTLRRN